MCLNGWGGKLHSRLLPYVAASAPDVLCLQEAVHSPESEKDRLTYCHGDHTLPQRVNFFRDVCDALPDHMATFCPAAQGVLWDDDVSVHSQWGIAAFVYKSFPLIGQVQGVFHESFSPVGYGDHPRSRSAHGVRVYDWSRNRPVSSTQMHGLRDPNGKMDTPGRATQAERLLCYPGALLSPMICPSFAVILMLNRTAKH